MAARKKIIKLAKKISGQTALLFKIDENAPEYTLIEPVVTDEMADVGLAMELRKPQRIEAIARKCKKSVEEARDLAMQLAKVGACIFHTEGNDYVFELTVYVPGVMEKVVSNKELCEKYPQIPKAFEEYARLRGEVLSPRMTVGMGPMRVIPIQSSIDGDSKSCSYEEIKTILDKNTLFAVSDCSCRRSRRLMGEGCGHLEHDICIQLGTGAEYYIKTGKAREITKEEAIAIIQKAEDNGLMHQIPNIDAGETHAICNCCGCSCYSLRNASYFNSPDMVRSNYVATVETEDCVACGQCVENCPVNALQLGQKLCEPKYDPLASTPSPRDHIWKKTDFNVDYRENRTNVTEDGTAPCKTACPAHIAVQGYIKLAAQGRYTEALELIKKENPFPAVCGRICPRKCEDACTRGNIDEPVAIDEIKKFIAQKDLDEKTRFIPRKRWDYGKDIAVIGSGPAGLSCAYYLAIDGYNVTVFEKEEKLGGMLTIGIPSFRLEKNVVNAEIEILSELGVKFQTGVEIGKDKSIQQLRDEGFKAFYVAIGAQGGRMLGLEGEDSEGVYAGVDFLKNVNQERESGLKGNVVVIGGGNVAIDVARAALRKTEGTISLYCLESREEMPSLLEEQEEALEEGISINNSWGPKKILTEGGKTTGIEFKKCLSVFDENKRFSPKYDENNTITVQADTILVSVGQSIQWGNLLEGTKVKLRGNKTAEADSFTYQTAEPDIFVGGDVYTGPYFAIDAIAAGKQGAISVHRYVWEGQSLTLGRDRREYKELNKEGLTIEGFDTGKRQRPVINKTDRKSFDDPRETFTEEQIKKETERCLGCGAVVVNQELCVGCGQCTTNCKFDAIKLERKYDREATTYELMPIKMVPHVLKRVGNIVARPLKEAVGSK